MHRKNITLLNYSAILILFFLALSQGCDDSICSNFNSSIVKISFFDKQTKAPKETVFDSITAIGSDSLFYLQDTLSVVPLPVNTLVDSTTFIFFNSGNSDTIRIKYYRDVSLISSTCGYTESFEQVQVPYSTFPEVIVKNNTLSITNDSDIQIYY